MQTLNYDVCYHIRSFLCYVDQVALASCHRNLICKIDIKAIIATNLLKMKIDPCALFEKMVRFDHVLTGRFLFTCIYNLELPSHVDFLTHANSWKEFETKPKMKLLPITSYEIDRFCYSKVHGMTSLEFICDYFNFDFYKIAFNGKKLFVYDWTTLFTRTCVYDVNQKTDIIKQKINMTQMTNKKRKLERQGFHITFINLRN